MRRWQAMLLLWLLIGLSVGASTMPALAHTEEESIVQLRDVALDGYRLTVLTAPRTLLVGPAHLVVLVTDADGRWVLLRQMMVEVTPLLHPDQLQVRPLLPMTLPLGSHETQLELPTPGHYQVTIRLADQSQPVSFEIEVLSGVWMRGLLSLLVGVTLLAAGWLVKEGFTVWQRSASS